MLILNLCIVIDNVFSMQQSEAIQPTLQGNPLFLFQWTEVQYVTVPQ